MTIDSVEEPTVEQTERAPNPRSAFWRLLKVLIVMALASSVLFLIERTTDNQIVSEVRTFNVAPEFEFISYDGETVRLVDLRGQGVVLNFWASWCGPCVAEAPLLVEAWEREQGNGIVFIGLTHQDKDANAVAFIAEKGLGYLNGPDEGLQWSRKYNVNGIPATFFIDADGMVVSQHRGMLFSAKDLAQNIDKIRPD